MATSTYINQIINPVLFSLSLLLTLTGRLHGVLQDPQNKYVTANIFAPSGGYVGVIDTTTKEAIALFRVTKMSLSDGASVTRNVHLSLFTADGSAIIVGKKSLYFIIVPLFRIICLSMMANVHDSIIIPKETWLDAPLKELT